MNSRVRKCLPEVRQAHSTPGQCCGREAAASIERRDRADARRARWPLCGHGTCKIPTHRPRPEDGPHDPRARNHPATGAQTGVFTSLSLAARAGRRSRRISPSVHAGERPRRPRSADRDAPEPRTVQSRHAVRRGYADRDPQAAHDPAMQTLVKKDRYRARGRQQASAPKL